VKQRLEGTQTQVFVRLTIGAMWEAWRLIEDRFLKRTLGREYRPLLDRPAADALERLKKRFGKGSGLSTIRNNFAFHHPGIDDIDAAFEKAAAEVDSEDADWAVYFNKALLNTSFFVSDYVFVHGMADALSEPDVNEAHRKLMGEMAPVANDLSEFAFGFAAAIFKRYVVGPLIARSRWAAGRRARCPHLRRGNEHACLNPTKRGGRVAESVLIGKRGQTTHSYSRSRLKPKKKPNDCNGTSTRTYPLAILRDER
jgi:fructose-specific component phosphotransferase system IIB-like protein